MAKRRIEDLDRNLKARDAKGAGRLRWVPADRSFTVRGLAWFHENGGRFWRLPVRAREKVREPVWNLAQCPAGAHLAFKSNTSTLAVRVTNRDTGYMPHMASTGSNGLFLYVGPPGRMRPWAAAIPERRSATFERLLFRGVARRTREFRLYLPLYKPLDALEVGLSPGARLLPPSAPTVKKPVVFYGTSITQGGCASTAGSDFVSTVGRRLNLDAVNLGFSGNGRGEPELAELIAEIDAALYVLDYAANVDAARLGRTLPRFVRILRDGHPSTPILLVTNLLAASYDFAPERRRVLEDRRDIMMAFYVRRRRSGDRHIHLADGFGLLPFGADALTVDGVHLSDHGFQIVAERLAAVIEQILLLDSEHPARPRGPRRRPVLPGKHVP